MKTTTPAHSLRVNLNGKVVRFTFRVVRGAFALTVISWEDGGDSLIIGSVEDARQTYANLRASGGEVVKAPRVEFGIAGSDDYFRPFVLIEGRRVLGNREDLDAARRAA
jgi:hypothetical protein